MKRLILVTAGFFLSLVLTAPASVVQAGSPEKNQKEEKQVKKKDARQAKKKQKTSAASGKTKAELHAAQIKKSEEGQKLRLQTIRREQGTTGN